VPILQEQTIRALAEELERLNARSTLRRWVHRLVGESEQEIRTAAADWQVEFLPDPDGDMNEGDLLVDSELVLPARPDLGVGERTRKITTVHTGSRATTREQTVGQLPSSSATASARASSTTTKSGHHCCEVVKDSLTIGRGGIAFPVDVRIASSPDVSREHARIRRDAATGRFFLIDLSSLGTTMNGRHIPKGYDEVDGTKRENGVETALPDTARIGLADTVFLEFRKGR
jgi:hypothetical protein